MKFVLSFFLLISCNLQAQHTWWKEAVVYQIYPRSFQDSNRDGIGDIPGIISRLDYLKDLGVNCIWISPFFKSPQRDFGYDISDYYQVDSLMGEEGSIELLIEEVHKREMTIVFDLVMNHSSDEHPWFIESSEDSLNPKANWYVWQKGRKHNTKPPNNWKATIGGSAWQYHKGRDAWYLASFLPYQPDLNYHNPATRKAMLDVARHWLAKGVDGFRLDIFNVIYEDPSFKNNPFSFRIMPSAENPDGFFQKMKYTVNYPDNYQFAKDLHQVLDEAGGRERFTVGEVFGEQKVVQKYLGEKGDGLHLVFLFDMLSYKFKSSFFRKKIQLYEQHYAPPYMPTLVFSNHDRKRSISRIGNDHEKAKLIATFQLTSRGVPFIYQGEEFGMTQAKIPAKQAQDPLAQMYSSIPQWALNLSKESLNRDECRTPMQWDSTENAGFTKGVPWLTVQDNYSKINLQAAQEDKESLLWTYKKLLKLRKQHIALRRGKIEILNKKIPNKVLAYKRTYEDEEIYVYINFSKKAKTINLPDSDMELLMGGGSSLSKPKHLAGYTAKIYRRKGI